MTTRAVTAVRSERLDLVPIPIEALEAILAGDLASCERALGHAPAPALLDPRYRAVLQLRRDELADDPSRAPWSIRAIVRRADGEMVGFVNFHGPPGINDTMRPGAAELGWTIFPPHRRRGYATEAARALMTWAAQEHGISHFISSTTPDNAASLRVHEKLGFRRTGEVVEGEIIFERRSRG